MIYILSIAFTLAFIMYQKHQFNDLVMERDVRWKTWANVMKGLFFFQFLLPVQADWRDVFLTASICALVFEFGYNRIVLNKGWFFNGESSLFDSIGVWKWIILFSSLLISSLIKFKIMLDSYFLGVPVGVFLLVPVVFIGTFFKAYNAEKGQADKHEVIDYSIRSGIRWSVATLVLIILVGLVSSLF